MEVRIVGIAAAMVAMWAPAPAHGAWRPQVTVGTGSFNDMVVMTDGTTALSLGGPIERAGDADVATVSRAGVVTRATVGRGVGGITEGRPGELMVGMAGLGPGVVVRARVGGEWQPPVTLAIEQGYSVRIAANRSGRAVAVWNDVTGRVRGAVRPNATAAWTSPRTLGRGTTPGVGLIATARVDPAGNAIVVWRTGRDRGSVFSRVMGAGDTDWRAIRRLSPPGRFTFDVHVAVGAGGDVLVGWESGGRLWLTGGRRITQLGPVTVQRPAGSVRSAPLLGIGPRGDAIVLWQTRRGRVLAMPRSRRGAFAPARFAPPRVSVELMRGYGHSGQVPVDGLGNATVVHDPLVCVGDAMASCSNLIRRRADGSWSRPREIIRMRLSGGERAFPFVGSNDSGRISIVGSSSTEMSDVSNPPESTIELTTGKP